MKKRKKKSNPDLCPDCGAKLVQKKEAREGRHFEIVDYCLACGTTLT